MGARSAALGGEASGCAIDQIALRGGASFDEEAVPVSVTLNGQVC